MPYVVISRQTQAMIEGNDRLIRRQGVEVAQGNGRVLVGKCLKKVGANEFFTLFAVKPAECVIDEREQTVRPEPAD